MTSTTNRFVRDLWRLSRPYFVSEDRLAAWGLLTAVIALTLFQVYMAVVFNEWYGRFYDALQNKVEGAFWEEMLWFCWLAAVAIVATLIRFWFNYTLQIRWRRWLTRRYTEEWLGGLTHYRLQFARTRTDNPDQRIAEDIKLFVQQTLTLTLGLLSAVGTLFVFAGILWALSGPITVPVFGGITIPGYMVWAAVVYAVLGTAITHLIGRRLVSINFDQERYEADFRFALMRFRENQEQIALIRGEPAELRGFADRFAMIVANWRRLVNYNLRVLTFTTGFNQAAIVFPFIVGAPRYFAGAISLGQLIQISNAFGQVQNALTYFVDAYTQLTDWAAVVKRLTTFERAVAEVHAEAAAGPRIERREVGDRLTVTNARIDLPHGGATLATVDLSVAPGESVLVSGPSGTGKSTLFRAIAGLWPYGGGAIDVPPAARSAFVPQKPYIPIGTLKDAICFPGDPATVDDATARQVMKDVGLHGFVDELHADHHWGQRLSGGEQQRVGFARLLVARPDWIFLDEATSALDPAAESMLYRLIRERLPQASIVSIGHREALAAFHDRPVVLTPRGEGVPARLAAAAPP
ncbi:MAG: ABC transporter ATP-binding protein/permease [Rhodospirillales bacterium]|jgi:putative ATP-binding cassette transporter